ncbi:MAG: A/G-specific adenine glycosylase [Actinomycetales bacterium]|nr:A/G-specific adenine glycosylase [Actinomycetales bacterium]
MRSSRAASLTPPITVLEAVTDAVLRWYNDNARDLPWRAPGTTPWGVLVSEVMAQQTPVARVAPQWLAWMRRWPTPAALAAATSAEVIAQWDRLGYPRRALRLRECAQVLCQEHGGEVPDDHGTLLTLPGIGDYTAAAVLAFAFGRRALVMDTNVRRVHARVFAGLANHRPHVTATERSSLDAVLPADEPRAAQWSQAVMELGAVTCRPQPSCADCPLQQRCAWHVAGKPEAPTPARRPQAFAGTDRQVRGKVMALLRAAHGDSVEMSAIEQVWHDREQLLRALDSLLADGLAEKAGGGQFHLPAS